MQEHDLTIGQLAASADVNVETVRYYQRRGLLSEPERPVGGIRRYAPADLARLRYIRRAQSMGFSLDEIVGLLELKGGRACAETRTLTEHKLLEVRKRLSALRRLERELMRLVASCGQARAGACCPTLELLEHGESKSLRRSRSRSAASS